MRKFFFFGMLLCCGFVSVAQSSGKIFKPFKVDFNVGYADPQGTATKAGALFSIEPKYGVTDQIDIGLSLGIAATARAVSNGNGGYSSATVKANLSYLLTGDY